MNSTQLPLEIPRPLHYNRGLFSDYYLAEHVPAEPDWFAMENKAREVLNYLRAIRDQVDLKALDEAQLEELWIKPVLSALGHNYSVQVKIRYRDRGYRKPDYVLTRSPEDANALTSAIYTPDQLAESALAVCDAKRWGVSLDQAPGQGLRNPSQQIDEYLRYSELPWGILTDGQYWRLYERETSKNNIYYSVDLFDLLDHEARDFLYFYAFFRQDAFTSDWLRQTREGSSDFAQRIGDQLEEQVYEALELIAQGFLDYRRNDLQPAVETLKTIYEQSLVFLYRLLFVLYAESRSVLPMDQSRPYRDNQSLDSIKKAVAAFAGSNLDPDHSIYYAKLKDLFFGIDRGNPRFTLPAYNGRLFSEDEFPFLAQYAVGDKYLAPAIDKMARVVVADRINGNHARLAFIDYRDLDVRHLGAIYEKLLEYHLDIATESLTLRGGKYTPAEKGDEIVKQPGEVYLRTGNYERKITGSYYTPDYIVRFIVERTLEPLLAEITGRYAVRDEEGHWVAHDPAGARQAILALNILDPATGSGHFMVEAMNYLAEWLRSLSILNPDELTNGEDELGFWKRQVVSACVYGVDINPLAVELAKLSLWLATLAQGRPLSFLDHHVKVGNSLVGARAGEIGANISDAAQERRARARETRAEAIGQGVLLDDDSFAPAVTLALEEMAQIESTLARTVEAVKGQEELYAHLSGEMAVWKQLADVWIARYFGVSIEQATWGAVRTALLTGEGDDPDAVEVLEQAAQVAAQQRFLHLELEFPEVFFNPDGTAKDDPGFDAIVGNPPYVRQERIQPIKGYLSLKYDIYQGTADLFLYFYEMGLRYLKRNQRLGYITSGTYMNSNSARAFRQLINQAAAFETAVNFGENQPFKGAEMVYPTIAVLRKGEPERTFRSLFIEGTRIPESLDDALAKDGIDCLADVTGMDEWRFQSVELTELFRKVTEGYETLSQIVDGRVYSGIKTGLGEAFVIDVVKRRSLIEEHPSSAEIIVPFRRGEDMRPWYQTTSDAYLIFAYQGIDIDLYPAVKKHLQKYQEALTKRAEAASGQCKWYELRPCSYYAEFQNPKILWAEISKLPRFSFNDQHFFTNNKCYFVVTSRKAVQGIMASRVTWFCLSQIATPLRLRAGLWQYQLFAQFVGRAPIPSLTNEHETILAQISEQVGDLASQRYQLHESMRQDIRGLGSNMILPRRLEEWWSLKDMASLQKEVERAGASIPVKQLAEWRDHLATQKAEHQHFTDQIVAKETQLNDIVYKAFKLNKHEIGLIEQSTKYPYGVA